MPAYFLSPALVRLRLETNTLWPNRSKTSDGWIGDTAHSARTSDHNPDYSQGGIVRAIDVTNDGINVDRFVSCVIRDVRTRYVITRGRIWTREAGWKAYTGSNGHYHHVHVSVRSVGAYDLQVHSWGLASTVANTSGGPGPVTNPSSPGSIPAPPKEENTLASEYTEADLRRIVAEGLLVASKATFTNTVRDAVWKAPIVDQSDGREKTAETYLSYLGKGFSGTRDALLGAVQTAGSDPAKIAAAVRDTLGDELAQQVVTELSNRLKG